MMRVISLFSERLYQKKRELTRIKFRRLQMLPNNIRGCIVNRNYTYFLIFQIIIYLLINGVVGYLCIINSLNSWKNDTIKNLEEFSIRLERH